MTKKSILFLFIGVVFLCAVHPASAQQKVKVIVHKDVTVSEIDQGTLQKIFLGKKQLWDDGSRIVPVLLKESPVHESFLNDLINRNETQFRLSWNRAVFTGKAVPLQVFDEEDALLKYVAETPGVIGYISSGKAADNVKVITVQ
ncbi:hypothetical protein JW948_04490 [bacterium]|nr:hypothetical protein [bacterium]